MKVKELFAKVKKEDILRAYRIMFELNSSSDKAKYSVPELVAYDKSFDEMAGKFIDAVVNVGESEVLKNMVIFVTQFSSEDYEEKNQKYFSSGAVYENEFRDKAGKDFTVWRHNGENNLTLYAYEMDSLESIANYRIAEQSIEDCSAVVCATEIFNEMIFHGLDKECRQDSIDKLKLDLDKAMGEVDEGKFISSDDLFTKMYQEELQSLKDEDERRHYELEHEYKKLFSISSLDGRKKFLRKIRNFFYRAASDRMKPERTNG